MNSQPLSDQARDSKFRAIGGLATLKAVHVERAPLERGKAIDTRVSDVGGSVTLVITIVVLCTCVLSAILSAMLMLKS